MVRKTAKQKSLRKPIKRRNKTLKNEPKFKMINSGFIKTISNINNKKSDDYVELKININGKLPQYKIYEQISSGNIKLFSDNIENISNNCACGPFSTYRRAV